MNQVLEAWPWLVIILMGAYHGINPAMGWLFAVAWGLQEKRSSAVLKAIAPIALGHAVSVALVVVLVGAVRLVFPPEIVQPIGATILILFGAYMFLRPRLHPRGAGMRVGFTELALWSFLMATAHGAGLMLFPVLLGVTAASSRNDHAHGQGPPALDLGAVPFLDGAMAVLLHTLAMLAVMTAVAFVVYEWLGVGFLRQSWANLDLLWAAILVVAGLLTFFV